MLLVGVLLLLSGSWWGWQVTHPPLTDQEQIATNLEAMRTAIEDRKPNHVLRYLADEFTWNGQNKRELASQIKGAFFQWRDVHPNITGLEIKVEGTHATATGKYSIALRPSPRMRPEVYLGEFQLQLEKRENIWLITNAQHQQ